MDLPAIFANQFALIVNPQTVRITFGDEPMTGRVPVVHTAVVMKTSDAKQLGELLLKLIAQNQETAVAARLLQDVNGSESG